MKTAEKNATAVQGTAAKNNQTVNHIDNRPNLTGKEAKQNETVKEQTPAQTPQAEKTSPGEIKAGSTAAVDNQPGNVAPFTTGQGIDEPKAEPAKADEAKAEAVQTTGARTEEVKAEPKKFAFNLEQTLKSVDCHHRRHSRIENNRTKVDLEMLVKLAGVLDVSQMDILSTQSAIVNSNSIRERRNHLGMWKHLCPTKKSCMKNSLPGKMRKSNTLMP
jgi:hypothetical protein